MVIGLSCGTAVSDVMNKAGANGEKVYDLIFHYWNGDLVSSYSRL